MKNEVEFYRCAHCGKIVLVMQGGGGALACCGEDMARISPNTVDAAVEKHVPVYTWDGDKLVVDVGSVPHPMAEEHYIQWVLVSTPYAMQCRCLSPGEAPRAEFLIKNSTPVTVLAYCNLHGLWQAG